MVLSTLKKTAKEFFVWFWILIFCTVVGFVLNYIMGSYWCELRYPNSETAFFPAAGCQIVVNDTYIPGDLSEDALRLIAERVDDMKHRGDGDGP